ncbi:MAG TPA: polyphosphate kinase [Alphaproteobacteria bacterium]|nr:polyphosphate kinase [Alphaproteobacteria bacterium]
MAKKIRLSKLKHPEPLADKADYEKRLDKLQKQMLSIQQTYFHERRRAILVFEGWDAAGKGGAIRRLTEQLDPRGFHVWPIGAPRPDEQGRHYLYRFWTRLPEPGTIAIFDRSWYGRVLVERVEGLISKSTWRRAYDEINEFERMLIEDGARVVKVFLHITPEEQLRRFTERLSNPYKRWKLTEEDIRNHQRWDDYAEAVEDMFDRTSTKAAPWNAIYAEKKWVARIAVLTAVTDALSSGVEIATLPMNPEVKKLGGLAYLRRQAAKGRSKSK